MLIRIAAGVRNLKSNIQYTDENLEILKAKIAHATADTRGDESRALVALVRAREAAK